MQSKSGNFPRPQMLLMDVYETMLDMSEVERRVNSITDSKRGYLIWFELFMEYCFVDNCTAQFNDFISIARATLKMTGKALRREVSEMEIDRVLELMKHLPLHAGVQKGLSLLNDMGFRMAALTNSSEKMVSDRMGPTGLVSYFERVLSAEHVHKYKPSIIVYKWAAEQLEVPLDEVLLVTAHGWDIAGGANAGMQTALIKRSNQVLYPLAPEPNYICTSLIDLAQKLQNYSPPAK